MSSAEAGNDERPRREVAHRIFAAEFEDATLSYSESDEERAPNYVVTPTGARANRLFVAGVLTELDELGNGQLRARIVDPTGAFVVYAGQYQPDALAALERLDPPAFVAVTGKARTFQPEDSERVFTSIRPESISEIDAATRDRWIVETAARTLDRVGAFAAHLVDASNGVEEFEADRGASIGDENGSEADTRSESDGPRSGLALAREHYGTTPAYLAALGELALDAARLVAGDEEEVGSLDRAPDDGGEADLAALAGSPLDGATVATVVGSEGESEQDGATTTVTDPDPDPDSGFGADAGSGTESGLGAERSGVDTDVEASGDATTGAQRSGGASAEKKATAPEDDAISTSDDEVKASAGDDGASEGVTSAVGDDIGGDDGGDSSEEFDGEFDLSDEERAEIEAEYGTNFSTGAEVDEPGEADIEPDTPADERPPADSAAGETGTADATDDAPSADDEPSAGEEPSTDVADVDDAELTETITDTDSTATETDGTDGTEIDAEIIDTDAADANAESADVDAGEDSDDDGATDDGDSEAVDGEDEGTDEPPTTDAVDDGGEADESTDGDGDVDVTEAVMNAMRDLDDGDGAERSAVIERVSDAHGVSTEEVEDAIDDALMGGQCYEPGDDTLKAI